LCSRVYKLDDVVSFAYPVCIKRVLEDDQAAPHSVEREVRCYSILSNLGGEDGIISLIAAFYDESDPFDIMTDLVMPYYPCTLQDLLDEPRMRLFKSEGHSDDGHHARVGLVISSKIHDVEAFVLRTCRSLFAALNHLHSNEVAHRDVKPSNIVVDERDRSIKLIDFGTCYLPTTSYPRGDDGKGGLASEVGTGAYRAPECLFSPLNGYEPKAVDVWQAGVCLAEFFLPLSKVRSPSNSKESVNAGFGAQQLDWEQALWADDRGVGWSELRNNFDRIDGHAPAFYQTTEDDDQEDDSLPVTASGWQREQLFDGSRSDLGLANSIFSLLGLPNGDEQGAKLWPEAVHFQPPLASIPFARRAPASGGLRAKLDAAAVTGTARTSKIIDVLSRCIRLSAASRIKAHTAMDLLREQ
jgi:serine/threonine protein kinase